MKSAIKPFLLIFLMLLAPACAFALEPRIDNVVVGTATVQLRGENNDVAGEQRQANHGVQTAPATLKVSFQVKDAFTAEIEEAIKSSIPTSFYFIIELSRVNKAWFDEEAGKWEFKHTVKYDSLKEEYEILSEEKDGEVVRTKELQVMKDVMTTGLNIILSTPTQLKPGNEYELKIKAELKTVRLPFLLNYMFFFAKLWDYKTEWHVHRFVL